MRKPADLFRVFVPVVMVVVVTCTWAFIYADNYHYRITNMSKIKAMELQYHAQIILSNITKDSVGDPNDSSSSSSSVSSVGSVSLSSTASSKDKRYFHADLHCYNKERSPRIELRSANYWVLYNYVRGSRDFSCDESVTYTTHGDYTFIENIVPLLKAWNGPISIAMFAPGADYVSSLQAIMYYRQCHPYSYFVRELVTFHLYFPVSHMPPPGTSILSQQALQDFEMDCESFNITQLLQKTPYKRQKYLDYPVNVARNVARQMAMTHFVFASDVELYPSPNAIPQFLDMIRRNDPILQRPNKRVYVFPIFEIYAGNRLPKTKSELIRYFRNGVIITFHKHICLNCHKIPKLDVWLNDTDPTSMAVTTIGKRTPPYQHWEPIYIGTNDDPIYDERLSWEGRADKMTQGYQLCLLDYDFYILNNAWLVHKPGVKKLRSNGKAFINASKVHVQNRLIGNSLVPHIKRFYGNKKGCV